MTPPTAVPQHLHIVREIPEQIVCPTWCEKSIDAHRAEIADPVLDGECQHVRRFQLTPNGCPDDMWLCCTTGPDGSAHDGLGPRVELLFALNDELSLDEAEEAG
jgi:hypothetical protein